MPEKLTAEEKLKLMLECGDYLPSNDLEDIIVALGPLLSAFKKTSVSELLRLHDATELKLPKFDNVVWHVSAGMDWRPLIFFSGKQMNKWNPEQQLSRPTLHINTCLNGDEELKLLDLLESDEPVFDDGLSQIFFETYSYVSLNDSRLARSRQGFCDFGRGSIFKEYHADGFLVNIKLVDLRTGYIEHTQLLYLLAENIQTFRRFVTDGEVKVKHLVATCEGLAFGG
jgi:hypothetical protein